MVRPGGFRKPAAQYDFLLSHLASPPLPLMESGKIISEIVAIVDKVTRKADRLVFNTTTN
jgi:hypothetical protein